MQKPHPSPALQRVGEGVLYVDFVALADLASRRGGDGKSPYRFWDEMLKHGVPATVVSLDPFRVRLPNGAERRVCKPAGSGAPRPMSAEEAVKSCSITRLCSRRQVACVICARRDWASRGCFAVRRLWDLRPPADGEEPDARLGRRTVDPVRPGCEEHPCWYPADEQHGAPRTFPWHWPNTRRAPESAVLGDGSRTLGGGRCSHAKNH